MKYGRLLGSYYDIGLYEFLASKTEWRAETFLNKMLDILSDGLIEDVEQTIRDEMGEMDEFLRDLLDEVLEINSYEIVQALVEDWIDEVLKPKIKDSMLKWY